MKKDYTIAVAGTGYVGLSIATLLSQHHKVMAVDIVKEKVDLINNRKSPIQDNYIRNSLEERKKNPNGDEFYIYQCSFSTNKDSLCLCRL